MTATTPTHVDSSIREIWAQDTLRDHLYEGFWARFVGDEGSRMPIIRKTELLNNPGDTIHIQITGPLSGSGVTGDTATLEGSEENLTTSSKKVVPLLRRHAVLVNRRAQKKSIVDLRFEAQMRLAEWGGEKMDDVRFSLFTQITDLNGESYAPTSTLAVGTTGTAGVYTDIGTTDTLDVETIQKARLTLYNNRAIPLRFDGVPYFAMVVHPNSLYNLKRSDEYRDWVREAHNRGESNPFFVGATALIDGVIIYEHPNVPVQDNSGTDVATNIMFGAEAFVEGVDENAEWNEDTFDYGKEWGVAYSFAFQPRRALEKNSLFVFACADAP